ncbi:hypothetical protein [Thalassovita sp.]|jgi:hypothetical protein|uniref:hypothetical protein n=1 Tax=Thalassovita sp. TaxID=1979401 RepID=UPI003B59F8BD
MDKNPHDPKGLIREAYRIEGIGSAECRTIFLDWALSLQDGHDQHVALENLYQTYAEADPDHPMSEVLQMGLKQITAPRRRGGWRGRSRN